MRAHLRIARPTDNLEDAARLYRDGLSFEVLGEFTDHVGFDGIMLGHSDADYHLELTRRRGHAAGRAPTQDPLLVFYIPDKHDWATACSRAESAGFRPVKSVNPYWDRNGTTFEDLDGYRVVLQCAAWPSGG